MLTSVTGRVEITGISHGSVVSTYNEKLHMKKYPQHGCRVQSKEKECNRVAHLIAGLTLLSRNSDKFLRRYRTGDETSPETKLQSKQGISTGNPICISYLEKGRTIRVLCVIHLYNGTNIKRTNIYVAKKLNFHQINQSMAKIEDLEFKTFIFIFITTKKIPSEMNSRSSHNKRLF